MGVTSVHVAAVRTQNPHDIIINKASAALNHSSNGAISVVELDSDRGRYHYYLCVEQRDCMWQRNEYSVSMAHCSRSCADWNKDAAYTTKPLNSCCRKEK